MEIKFGQYFDQGYYLDYTRPENQAIFNQQIVGPMGLLGLLERELGLIGKFPSQLERRVRYRENLLEFITHNPNTLIAASFNNDPEGVAKELLRWRDQLIIAGWTPNLQGISTKIDILSTVENQFGNYPGPEDRWIKVLTELNRKSAGTLAIKKISLRESLADQHPFYTKLFTALQASGIELCGCEPEMTIDERTTLDRLKNSINLASGPCEIVAGDTTSLQILRFKSEFEATEFLASRAADLKNTLIFNRDNRLFDEMLNSFGQPVSGSSQVNAHPQVIQLFRLVSVLFITPVNIHNFISYLLTDLNPVTPSLRYRLIKSIKKTGGIHNPEWDEIIREFEFKDDAQRGRCLNFLSIRNNHENQIPVTEVSKLYHSLITWAQQRQQIDETPEMLKEQLLYLIELSHILSIILENKGDFITGNELNLLIRGVYESGSFKNYKPQQGSVRVVAWPAQALDDVDTCIWLDCYNEEMKPEMYDFLNSLEISNLANLQTPVNIWNIEKQILSKFKMLTSGLQLARKRMVLIIIETSSGKSTTDHPVLSLVRTSVQNPNYLTWETEPFDPALHPTLGWSNPGTIAFTTASLPIKQPNHEIANGHLIEQRETESASSIELLIQDPFDWVMQYRAKIQKGNSYELADVFRTQGTVAHKFIELLFQDAAMQTNQAVLLLGNYENRLQDVVYKYGMVLLLEENCFEYQVFKKTLKGSVVNLLNILTINHLVPIALEMASTAEIPGLSNRQVQGFIDLVVETPNNGPAIIDLKWSGKEGYHKELMMENRHHQLVIYKALLESTNNRNVNFLAYYALADNQLISSIYLEGEGVINPNMLEPTEEILKRIDNSINFRMEQLQGGIIEECNGQDMTDLEYIAVQNDKNLVPLNPESDSKSKIKKTNYYSNYQIFKGE